MKLANIFSFISFRVTWTLTIIRSSIRAESNSRYRHALIPKVLTSTRPTYFLVSKLVLQNIEQSEKATNDFYLESN